MKKSLLFFAVISLLLISLFSCGDGGEDPKDSGAFSLVYADTELRDSTVSELCVALEQSGFAVSQGNESEPQAKEIIIGRSARQVSVTAYEKLGRMRLDEEVEQDLILEPVKILVYSDGRSVAVAYTDTEDTLLGKYAVEQFTETVISKLGSAKSGILYKASLDSYLLYEARDAELIGAAWKKVEEKAGAATAEALKSFYELYSDSAIDWLANLYEPAVCFCDTETCTGGENCIGAGFYYSNSARDNYGFYPDAESTSQALNMLINTGMISSLGNSLPDGMKSDIIAYLKSLQDPEDGCFYHPQWGKEILTSRRNRDLTNATGIISKLGGSPTYDTPDGYKGDGILADGSAVPTARSLTGRLASGVKAAIASLAEKNSEVLAVSSSFSSSAALIEYLESGAGSSTTVNESSYSFANTLQSQMASIKAADAKTSDDLMRTVAEWLDSKQQPSGIWDAEISDSIYTPINGLMKLTMCYNATGYEVPNLDKVIKWCISAAQTNEMPYAITDVRNVWDTIRMLSDKIENGSNTEAKTALAEFRKDPVAVINSAREKFALFLRTDGSFGYYVDTSAPSSQGAPVALAGELEGDVNATAMTAGGVAEMIFHSLGLGDCSVPTYTSSDFMHFMAIIEELGHVVKNENSFEMEESASAENRGTGKYVDAAIDYTGLSVSKLVSQERVSLDQLLAADRLGIGIFAGVTKDRDDECLVFGKRSTGEANLTLYPDTSSGSTSYVFETDVCVFGGSTSYSDGGIFSFYFMNGETYIWRPSKSIVQVVDDDGAYTAWTLNDKANVSYADYGEWHNIRIEVQDSASSSSNVRVYLDNVIVFKNTYNSSYDEITHIDMRWRGDSSLDSLLLLDNTYFGTVEDLYDDPAVPDLIEEKPTDRANGGTRGTGAYYSVAETFTDSAVKDMKKSGYVTVKKGISKGTNSLLVPTVDGNEALRLETSSTEESRVFLKKSVADIEGFVFEADVMVKNVASTRSDNVFVSLYGTRSTDSISGLLYDVTVSIKGDGTLAFGGESTSLEDGVWYNIRIETDNIEAGDNVRLYVNGQEMFTKAMSNTGISTLVGMDMIVFNGSTGSVYLDNVYMASVYDPDAPEPAPDYPTLESVGRGTGEYCESAESYTGKTASEVGTVVSGFIESETASNRVTVSEIDGDSTIGFTQTSSATTRFTVANTESGTGEKLLFESDIMLKNLTSTRSDGAAFSIIGTSNMSGNAGVYAFNVAFFKEGSYNVMSAGGYKAVIPEGEWFNIRLEFEGRAKGSELRVILNGDLAITSSVSSAMSIVKGAQVIGLPNMGGSIYLDNTYITYTDSFGHGAEEDGAVKEFLDVEVLDVKGGANGIFVLMHDDGSLTTMKNMDALLEKYGMVADLALILSTVYDLESETTKSDYGGYVPYMTNGRWKLVSHSATHTWYGTETDTDGDGTTDTLTEDTALIEKEIVTSRDILRNLFAGQRVLTFAYPGYSAQLGKYGYSAAFTDTFKEKIASTYISGRRANNNPVTAIGDNVSWEELGAFSLDYDNYDAAISALNKVSTDGGLAIFYTHRVFEMTDEEIAAGSYANNSMSVSCLDKILGTASSYVNDGSIWNANYEDAILYLREAQSATVSVSGDESALTVTLTDELDDAIYNHALTVRIAAHDSWSAVKIVQGDSVSYAKVKEICGVRVIDADITPDAEVAMLTPISVSEIPGENLPGDDTPTVSDTPADQHYSDSLWTDER